MVAVPVHSPADLWTPQMLPPKTLKEYERWKPQSPLGVSIARALPYLPDDLAAEVLDAISSSVVLHSRLWLRVLRSRDSRFFVGDEVEDYGLVSRKEVTDAGVGFIVDAFQNSVELETMEFHGIGTGTTAADQTDTDIETELTTEYVSNNTRATGTNAEGASANIYQTVATNTLDSGTPAITEHGVLSNATVGSGVLFDRHVFSAINLDGTSGDSLQSTYEATFSAGG